MIRPVILHHLADIAHLCVADGVSSYPMLTISLCKLVAWLDVHRLADYGDYCGMVHHYGLGEFIATEQLYLSK